MKRELLARLMERTRLQKRLDTLPSWSGVLALNYHRIGDGSRSLFDRDLWSADAAGFEEQVAYLQRHFEVISPADLAQLVPRRRGRFVIITFDDGYIDNYRVAFPILKQYSVPATFFICTGFLDRPRLAWWDEIAWMVRTSPRSEVYVPRWMSAPVLFDEPAREQAVCRLLRAYKSLPSYFTRAFLDDLARAAGTGRFRAEDAASEWMSWDMVREMKAAGMTIGGHTVNHPVLSQMSRARQAEEIAGCGRRLAEVLGEPMRYFSYPDGKPYAFTADTRSCLEEAGVELAFSYYGGFRRFADWDAYDVRRLAVEPYTAPWFRPMMTLPQLFGRVEA
jgi:peptidoglycan/xylan/chitin deacetylase (PgdA/CDA1 family)